MSEKKNIVRKPKKKTRARSGSKKGLIGKTTSGILGGEMLSVGTFRFFPFLVFIAFLAFIYISNNYYAEAKIREINHLRKEMKEINYEYITGKSKLEELSKQSQLARRLKKQGIKESTKPVKTIKVTKDQNQR